MTKKPISKKLTEKQKLSLKKHIEKIQAAHKELQEVLSGIGIKPVGGWKDPAEFQLVRGIEFVKEECDECDECSVVCFDGDCGECLECAGDVIKFENIRWTSYPADRVLVETTREGILKVHLKAK